MPDTILFVAPKTQLNILISQSLIAEGFRVVAANATPQAIFQNLKHTNPDLVLINTIDQPALWLVQAEVIDWPIPSIILADHPQQATRTTHRLVSPFSFQELLVLIQDIFNQNAAGNTSKLVQLPAIVLSKIDPLLAALLQNLQATCVILSTSSGWLLQTVGEIDQGTATSLAALMSASFSATARAAQVLGHREMFDSNLQESEGYGLYAIRLQDQLILSVAFSSKTTIGMVRYYTTQLAQDILKLLADEDESAPDPDLSQTINHALDQLLINLSDIHFDDRDQ